MACILNIGKADTQDHRQARAEPPADGIQLEECAHGGHHQGCLDQQHLLLLAEADGSGDDDSGVTHPTIMQLHAAEPEAVPAKEGMPFSSKTDACFCVTDEFEFDIISS